MLVLKLKWSKYVPLANESELVCQDIGVRGYASYGAHNVVVELVDFLREKNLVQKFVCVSLLSRQEDSVVCQDAQTSSGVAYGLHGVLHLVQPALGREYCCPGVVPASLQISNSPLFYLYSSLVAEYLFKHLLLSCQFYFDGCTVKKWIVNYILINLNK